MINPRALAAVHNNAIWCNTVCVEHGSPCEFIAGAWFNRGTPPPYYFNLVTMQAGASTRAQERPSASTRLRIRRRALASMTVSRALIPSPREGAAACFVWPLRPRDCGLMQRASWRERSRSVGCVLTRTQN